MRKLFLTIIVLAICSITYGQNINEDFQKNIEELQTKITNLKTSNSFLTKNVKELQNAISEQNTKIDNLLVSSGMAENKVNASLDSLNATKKDISILEEKLDELSNSTNHKSTHLAIIIFITLLLVVVVFIYFKLKERKYIKKYNEDILVINKDINNKIESINKTIENKINELNKTIKETNTSFEKKVNNFIEQTNEKHTQTNTLINAKIEEFKVSPMKEIDKTKSLTEAQVSKLIDNHKTAEKKIADNDKILTSKIEKLNIEFEKFKKSI